MDYLSITNILEIILLVAVMFILIRFIFSNYSGKLRKPQAWIDAVKERKVSKELIKLEKIYGDRIRLYNIWMQIERLKKDNIEGDFAELGVYKGKTAKVIHLCDTLRNLHLFDTFEGFPGEDLLDEKGKAATYTPRHFSDTSLEKVKAYLGDHSNIYFHQGYFPDTATAVKEKTFAFVSMDVDLHHPTLAGLKFFYPRLSPGGMIMVHDYNSDWPELMRAVDQFSTNISVPLIPLPDADSTIMIIKGKLH